MKIINRFNKTEQWLVYEGKSEYCLILPENANEYERKAAEEFNLLLQQSAQTTLPIIEEKSAPAQRRIFLGRVENATGIAGEISYQRLGSDGFILKTEGDDLYIVGADRGTLFGVYGYFERVLGYQYYAKGEMKIDKTENVAFYQMDVFEKPDIDARSFGFYDTYHVGYKDVEQNADRLRIARNNYTDWVLAGHSYFTIMPKAKYGETRPDFYSPDGQNLCLSAEGLEEEFSKNLIEIIQKTPGRYVMIGQEDNFGFCDCEKCQEEVKRLGTESALMMRFSNRIAKTVGEYFKTHSPDRDLQFVTFAYNKTAKPPVMQKDGALVPLNQDCIAADNLSVMVVPFGAVYNYPFNDERENKRVRDNFVGWAVCCKKMHVWSYCTNFDNYFIEFDNYSTIAENYRFFKQLNVDYLFDQGSYSSRTPTFEELKIFLHSRLAWDTSLDTEELIDEFIQQYYKECAPLVKKYFEKVRARWAYIHTQYGEYTRPGAGDSSFLNLAHFWPKEYLDECMDLFREMRGVAESIALKDWDRYVLLRNRTEKLAISPRFLLVNIYGKYFGGELAKKVDLLRQDMNKHGIIKTCEGDFMELC